MHNLMVVVLLLPFSNFCMRFLCLLPSIYLFVVCHLHITLFLVCSLRRLFFHSLHHGRTSFNVDDGGMLREGIDLYVPSSGISCVSFCCDL